MTNLGSVESTQWRWTLAAHMLPFLIAIRKRNSRAWLVTHVAARKNYQMHDKLNYIRNNFHCQEKGIKLEVNHTNSRVVGGVHVGSNCTDDSVFVVHLQ